MRYRVLSASNTLLLACFFSGLGVLLAILCLIGGISSNAFESAFVATFDTTALRTSLSNDSYTPPIADWYSLHMTTVCSGSWTPGSENLTVAYAKEKENSTMICTSHGVHWTFSLSSIVSAAAPSANDVAGLDSHFHADMTTPSALLIAGAATGFLALAGLFATSFKHGFGPSTHMVGVASVVVEFLSAVLVIAGAATLTTARKSVTSSKSLPEGVQAFTSANFMTLLWVAAMVPLVAGGIGIIGQHKEKRMHGSGEKSAPSKIAKIPSFSSTGTSNHSYSASSSNGNTPPQRHSRTMSSAQQQRQRSRGASDATVVSNGRIRAGSVVTNKSYGTTGPARHSRSQSSVSRRARADSAGVASLKLGYTSSQGSTQSTAPNSGRERRDSQLPTSGSFGGRRYGV